MSCGIQLHIFTIIRPSVCCYLWAKYLWVLDVHILFIIYYKTYKINRPTIYTTITKVSKGQIEFFNDFETNLLYSKLYQYDYAEN